jgi:hypothetical protein
MRPAWELGVVRDKRWTVLDGVQYTIASSTVSANGVSMGAQL